jgi:hypothetical protein
MRKILFIVMLFAFKTSFAQQDTVGLNIPTKDQKIIYEGIVDIPNKSKADLYTNAQKWFIDKFTNSNYIIQHEDEDKGQLISNGTITTAIKGRMGIPWNFLNKMTIQIDCKDNKYRYRIYNIITNLPGGGIDDTPLETPYYSLVSGKWVINEKFTKSLIQNTNTDIRALIETLIKAMNAKKDDF